MNSHFKPIDQSSTLNLIYDCALDPSLWPVAIERVASLFGAVNGVIVMLDLTKFEVVFNSSWNVRPADMLEFQTHFAADNPLNAKFHAFDEGVPYNVLSVMKEKEFLATRLYREFGSPRGFKDSLGVTVLRTPTRMVSFSLALPDSHEFTGPRELAVLEELAPHIRRTILISDTLGLKTVEARNLASGMDAFSCGIILLNSLGNILFTNQAAEAVISASNCLHKDDAKLNADGPTGEALRKAIAANNSRQHDAGKSATTIVIPMESNRVMFGHVLPLSTDTTTDDKGARATVAIFLSQAETMPLAGGEVWRSAFGISAAETKVLELLITGMKVVALAKQLGIAEATARSHLKRLYQKTGCKSMVELVVLARKLVQHAS